MNAVSKYSETDMDTFYNRLSEHDAGEHIRFVSLGGYGCPSCEEWDDVNAIRDYLGL